MIVGLDHVQVAAPPGCEAEARGFYGRLLGMRELQKPPALAARGGVWFEHLHIGVEQDFSAARKAHPALAVRDPIELSALAERLTAAGVPVTWDADIPGVSRFYTEDPWGNRLEILAYSS
jgi:catechol 2,3-dioxygenase-like lactoylglutathione lyase family enzyme